MPPKKAARKAAKAAAAPKQPDEFRIARLIRYMDASRGILPAIGDWPFEFRVGDPDFRTNYGCFLLYVTYIPGQTEQRMRNYTGQEGYVPTRMLQYIDMPWGLPLTLELDEDGDPSKINRLDNILSYVEPDGNSFESNTVVHLYETAAGGEQHFVDFEGYLGEVEIENVTPVDERNRPWDVLVDADSFIAAIEAREANVDFLENALADIVRVRRP
jgi:hypothetical protein